MKVSRSKLNQIIKEEILKIREGIQDLNLAQSMSSGEVDSTPEDKSDDKKDKVKKVKKGMSTSAARSYAKSFLRNKDKDPDILNNHSGFRTFLKDNTKTYWPSMETSEIKEEIRYWLNQNILSVKQQPKKKKSRSNKK
jgi:hypothetical protein